VSAADLAHLTAERIARGEVARPTTKVHARLAAGVTLCASVALRPRITLDPERVTCARCQAALRRRGMVAA